MIIRPFNNTDRDAVIQLWHDCQLTRPWNDPGKDIDRKMQFQPNLFFVGTIGKHIMASAMAGYDGHRGSIFYLAVHPTYQGSHYGKILMTHIESKLVTLGCPKVNIVVRSSNATALGFYDTLGYTQDDVISTGKRLIADT